MRRTLNCIVLIVLSFCIGASIGLGVGYLQGWMHGDEDGWNRAMMR